ncbi:MAG TPA: alpha/beta fold hydrolase [Spirochaetia bacterium]
MGVDGKYLDTRFGRLFYIEEGSGAPILYVHGNTGSCRWFSRVMDVPGHRTVAPDMPNFGRSSPLEGEPDIDRYADAVLDFAQSLGLDRPILVGHSLGGAVAISLAVRHPSAVRGLVLVDSAAPSGLVTPKEHYPLLEMMRTNRDMLSRALRGVVPTLRDEDLFGLLVDDAAMMAAPAWSGNAKALEHFDYAGRCEAYDEPVLVVWGRKDAIVTEAMAQETARELPRSRLEILEDIGHSVVVEDPARFRSLLLDYAAGLR